MHLESKNPWLVSSDALLGDQGRVNLEQDVLERGAKVGAVDGRMPRGFRIIEVFAFAAVEFDGLDVGEVGHAGRKEGMVLAHNAGAFAKVAFLIFLKLDTVSLSVSEFLQGPW